MGVGGGGGDSPGDKEGTQVFPFWATGPSPGQKANSMSALGQVSQQMVCESQKERKARPEQSQVAFISFSRLGWPIRAVLAIEGKILDMFREKKRNREENKLKKITSQECHKK